MGRPEARIKRTNPGLGPVADLLRVMRDSAGVTYETLASHTNYSPAHLKRAARGEWTDTEVVRAYAEACVAYGACPSTVRQVVRFHQAATESRAEAAREARRSKVVPKPQYARDEADLSGAMRDAWARAGRPSARKIESTSYWQVPRSTANAISNGHTVPKDVRQYVDYLKACEIADDALAPWLHAWVKVRGRPTATEEQHLVERSLNPELTRLYLQAASGAAMKSKQKARLNTLLAEARAAKKRPRACELCLLCKPAYGRSPVALTTV
ncbi:helix-turn-helix domain-containing protein [Streptomyces sp. NPDC059101]|uniref:helix-turn-helix domain-containing protein n=1 Tax=Streptomyces sp. NPDC059101 TaxID=3346728 RepID=UPI003686346D